MTEGRAELEREVARLTKINQALLGRVERSMNMQGDAFALFQAATVLEKKVKERTLELEQALRELRLTNRDLSEAKEAAEAAVRFKDAFLASMSHELRTPLNAVLGLSETLQDGVYGPVSDRQAECLRTIESSGRHLLTLINDILDLAKLGAGGFSANLGVVTLQAVCGGCLQLVQQQAERKRVELKLDMSRSPAGLVSDEKRLKQILVNLLGNAVKFTPSGGSVELAVELESDGSTLFSVSDTGIGISPENLERVFQPFVQIESSLSRRYEGTGLGLALVQQLSTLLGGSVSVESTPGRGSRFSVRLPPSSELAAGGSVPRDTQIGNLRRSSLRVREALTATNSEMLAVGGVSEPSIAPTGTRGLVLLAEDNEANQATIGGYLNARGYQVELAKNGREAVEFAGRKAFDIVLMDVQMPEMDGLTAIQRIRENAEMGNMPIIALTALAMVGDRERCLAAGADEYLSKPLVLRDLVRHMEAHLNTR
ncbi:MAG: ATP-binding protein [Polyangiaceae bacterium]|nr:ATP-binding protein [Polyangiaceae bacterium]